MFTALGSVLVGLSQLEHVTWQSVAGLLGAVLVGKALFTKPGDIPFETFVEVLEGKRPTDPDWPPTDRDG